MSATRVFGVWGNQIKINPKKYAAQGRTWTHASQIGTPGVLPTRPTSQTNVEENYQLTTIHLPNDCEEFWAPCAAYMFLMLVVGGGNFNFQVCTTECSLMPLNIMKVIIVVSATRVFGVWSEQIKINPKKVSCPGRDSNPRLPDWYSGCCSH